MRLLILVLFSMFFMACTSMSYVSTYNNGRVKQTLSASGMGKHTLIGMGRIDFDYNSKRVYVTCAGRETIGYDHEVMQGYDCDRDEPIYRD